MRLINFIRQRCQLGRPAARALIVAGRVRVDQRVQCDGGYRVTPYNLISLDDDCLQQGTPLYLMMHKPAGVVSATEHPHHPTVIDRLPAEYRPGLHLAGRLDLTTTGLLLLTNDGLWSKRLSRPEHKVAKVYRVTTALPITDDYVRQFEEGIYFAYEGITTAPAQLQLIDPFNARLTLFEGRYHQVKRMFGFFDNPVVALHRERIGELVLDPVLAPGQYRPLSEAEIALFPVTP
ncbi:16S rRNA pseudouridine(516) synthase [Aestuariirhabdus litorea]|uniref:Pseudouridine synthase n=1 Tax=Aestuariirhabdus litorea TaxID=2528527 RepID=A0A3P3VRD8_9GAMM|nr:16S rRNA pseudouridine(516) synthase [Aestuariirhabdus litorea]RRJ84089.1 16S rRNA pseudouridine(516) synthase [Aestuariirhabdus litorea]RWW97309.1 pseudouridine synthase [Endozoicomonadaceae bacterium GTF-13]